MKSSRAIIRMEKYGMYGLAEFPIQEYKRRVQKIQTSMREQDVGALMLTAEGNIFYFSGYRGTSGAENVDYAPAVLVIPAEGEPQLIISVSSRGNVEAMAGGVAPVYLGWDGLSNLTDITKLSQESLAEASAKALKESCSKSSKRVGAELGGRMRMGVSFEVFDQIQHKIDDVDVIDSSSLVWSSRTIKSPLEINYLEDCCEKTCTCFDHAIKSLKEGMTEREFARALFKEMVDEGFEDTPTRLFLNTRAGSDRYPMCDTRPSGRKLRKGDSIIVDGGGYMHGYFSDITRIAVVGEPSTKQRELYDAARKASEFGVDQIKDGVRAGDIWDSVFHFIKESGYEKYQMYEGVGHGIGIDIHEPPYISPGSDHVLREGMVVTMEPCFYDRPVIDGILEGRSTPTAEGVFFVEDEVLVTNGKPIILSSTLDRDIFVV